MAFRRWLIRRLPILLFALAFPGSWARAHPVSQGAMAITVAPERIEIRARASNEEAFVAEAFGPAHPDDGLASVWTRHGEYLLTHVTVSAGGLPLQGRLVRVVPPADPAATTLGEYDLEYDLPAESHRPAAVQFQQSVLNEFIYAPGNRWEATYVVTIVQTGQPAHEGLLFTSRAPLDFACDWQAAPAAAGAPPVLDQGALFSAYLKLGVMHILTGYDHLLFMLALALAVVTLADLIKVVTAFTIAHTLTLTLSVLNVIRVPERVVQPMIAASIVFVAIQNIFWPRQTRGWSRLLIAFGFGLFHGLGFAGGLLGAMAGLPGLAVATAIVAFSIGVELGHQGVVLPVFSAMQIARQSIPPRDGRDLVRLFALRFGSAVVCLGGMVYLVAALR